MMDTIVKVTPERLAEAEAWMTPERLAAFDAMTDDDIAAQITSNADAAPELGRAGMVEVPEADIVAHAGIAAE
jgi:hypothetical protein